jgi:hypothetical protein
MEHGLGDVPVVGEEEQALGIEVQATHREQALTQCLRRQEIEHGRSSLGIPRAGDDATRLVQDPVGSRLRDDGTSVQRDLVLLRVCGRSEGSGDTVDADASGAYQLLGLPPGSHPGPGQ